MGHFEDGYRKMAIGDRDFFDATERVKANLRSGDMWGTGYCQQASGSCSSQISHWEAIFHKIEQIDPTITVEIG
jgi:hypothetical protein